MKRLLILLALLLPTVASALENSLTWEAVTDTRAQGYNVYCATSVDGPWSKVGTVAERSATTLNVTPCASTGIVYYVVRSYGIGIPESVNSNIAQKDITTPDAPVIPACPVAPPPAMVYVVATNGTRPDRPLKNDLFEEIGRIEILNGAAPRQCEATPVVVNSATGTQYRYATNNAGRRGLTICKAAP